jgi:predicted O-methyltransferase YrrM
MTTFTTDWFSYAIPNFVAIKQRLGQVNSILEIGVYQGRSTCWQLENMLSDTGTITCLDPFIDMDYTALAVGHLPAKNQAELDREALFRANTAEVKKPGQTLEVMVDRSFSGLADLIQQERQFDFIYCDGNHASHAVLADACMCFGLLKKGGVLLFDDYLWDHVPDHLDRCKMSIDAFVNMFAKQVTPIIINYQLAVIKH